MAERRRHKKRIQVSEPTKEEKAVAKYLRFNCPTKSTNMMGHRVDYFISKAVDCLLDSKWAKAKKGEEALFTTRESAVDYCNDDSPGTPKKKKEVKKKFKLEPHEDQLFLDGNEVYVWIYDPVHFKTFAMGLILIAVIAATLFPLWPAEMRVGVYYLSVAAGCFVASILLLAVRCILFLIIWLVTGGRHHFWFLPNLTADVGFIDSFRPLYTHEYKGPRGSEKKGTDKSDEKDGGTSTKAQKSDSDEKSDSEKKDGYEEEEEDEEESKEVGREEGKEAEGEGTEERQSDTDSDRREDEGSQHSNGNDFEMITREELEQHTEEEEEEEEDEETQERKERFVSETKPQTAQT
uniref:Translocation protein SEC62 n=1 Tax=Pundamilia nyererei TaxID=303518 RepID=A0A3B4FKK6_9CICH